MSPPRGRCVDCGESVEYAQSFVHEVHGYASSRSGGGVNHVREITRLDGRIWHEQCFESWLRRARGRGEQAAML